MEQVFFLYIDILGFKQLIDDNERVLDLYKTIDKLNVHSDEDFHTIVFSDTILVAADKRWNSHPSRAIMWLVEFSQDLFYRLSHKDIHFRALVTKGSFSFKKYKNFEAYHGKALVDCYLKETQIKCCGTFIDNKLVRHSDIFQTSKYDRDVSFVHIMQHLDEISFSYEHYPIDGYVLKATGMEWWVAYLLRYLETVYRHSIDPNLPSDVRTKFVMTWNMISQRHEGLLRRLVEAEFKANEVITLDWTEPMARIGTERGAWG